MEEKISKIKQLGLQLKKCNMDDETFYKLCDLLYEFQDIFATSLADLTGSEIIKADINRRPDARPFRVKAYRLNDTMRKELYKQLDVMEKASVISKSDNSVWAFPVTWYESLQANRDFALTCED